VALPARLGLVVIGGEGAIVLGGVAAGALGVALAGTHPFIALPLMAAGAMAVGAVWIGAVGALRHYRGVNETIASLLMAYIAIALMNHLVEGPLRDPASLNKPSTATLPDDFASARHAGVRRALGPAFGIWPASSPGCSSTARPGASPRASPAATCAPRRCRGCRWGG
jgi:general nucleoside transport system permease protein